MKNNNNKVGFFEKLKQTLGIGKTTTQNKVKPNQTEQEKKLHTNKNNTQNKTTANPGNKSNTINQNKTQEKTNNNLSNTNNSTKENDIIIGYDPDLVNKKKSIPPIKKPNTEEDNNENEDNNSDAKSKFAEKFQKKGIGPKKDLKQIAQEAEQKIKEQEGKAFSESDAAQKDLKKHEAGYEKIIKKKTKKALEGKVFLVRGKDGGRPAWHYVLVSPENIAELKKQKSGTNIDVADFGKIVKSGWGEDPSPEIVKEIEEQYGD